MIFGSLLSVKFVTIGRRLSAIVFSGLVIASMIPVIIWLDYYVICAARFFFGFAAGGLITCVNLMLAETVPKEK